MLKKIKGESKSGKNTGDEKYIDTLGIRIREDLQK